MAKWHEEIPEPLRVDPALKDIPDVGTLAKNYLETKSFVGSSIRPPGPDAGPEAKKEFREKLKKHAPDLIEFSEDEAAQGEIWNRLGRGSKPEDYDYKPPDGVELPLENLKQVAIQAGMTKKQFEKFAASAADTSKKMTEAVKADQTALKNEWGQAYDQKLASIASTAKKLGAPDAVVANIATGKMESGALKMWDAVAKAIGPGENSNIAQQGGQQGAGKLTPAEAETQIVEIQARPDRAYWSKNHPMHATLVKKVLELQEAAQKK